MTTFVDTGDSLLIFRPDAAELRITHNNGTDEVELRMRPNRAGMLARADVVVQAAVHHLRRVKSDEV